MLRFAPLCVPRRGWHGVRVVVPEWLWLGAPPSARSPACKMGNAYENGFLLRLEGQQLGLALLLAQDSGRFFDPLEILLADDEGCCRVLHGDAGGEGHGKGVSLAPSILQPPPCPPGLAVGAARAVRGQESPPSNAGSTRAVASPVAPVLPVRGGKRGTESAVKAAAVRGEQDVQQGRVHPGKHPNLQHVPGRSPPNNARNISGQADRAVIWGKCHRCPDPFFPVGRPARP